MDRMAGCTLDGLAFCMCNPSFKVLVPFLVSVPTGEHLEVSQYITYSIVSKYIASTTAVDYQR